MQQQPPFKPFGQEHAAQYDKQFAKLSPMRDALHLIIGGIFSNLPADARILCVGAGTGLEIIYLAQRFPDWRFMAVDPSSHMLDVCRQRMQENGIADRCEFHVGYLDSLPQGESFDAVTSLLVSQFILAKEERTRYFRNIAERLKPRGLLVNADLASDTKSDLYESLIAVWLRLMKGADIAPEMIENFRTTYSRDVAVLPADEVSGIIQSGGFEQPVLFFQSVLIHAWYAIK
jgi:tRNA (cmo5U34)-methyltransferase